MKCLVDIGLRDGSPIDWLAVLTSMKVLSDLVKDEGLVPIPCLETGLLELARSAPELRANRDIMEKWLVQLTVWGPSDSPCEAEIANKADDLSARWKQSLRGTLASDCDWRTPQILVGTNRRSAWPAGTVVSVDAPLCGALPLIGSRSVPLIQITDYDGHPQARSDRDPWDLRAHHPPQEGDPPHPCLLPKPPSCKDVAVDGLKAVVESCRVRFSDSIWHYVPPVHWDPQAITEAHWRKGDAFPSGKIDNRFGYLDRDGKVWQWDFQERHWDVQSAGEAHKRVSHSGELLG